MASTNRQRYNNLGDNGATNGVTMALNGTTATWAVGHGFPTIASPSYAVFTVNPGTANEEIVQITACTAAGTTATVVRNFEATQGGANAAPACSAAAWSHGATVADFTGDSAWVVVGSGGSAPSFQNSWVNYGSTLATAAFRKLSSGLVQVKGLVKSGSNTSTIFTFPAGYRPLEQHLFIAMANNNAVDTTARLNLTSDGQLATQDIAVGAGGFVSLSFSFYAEQ